MCIGTLKCGIMDSSQYGAISEIGTYIHLKYFASQKRPLLVLPDRLLALPYNRGVGRSHLRLTAAHGNGGASTKLKANAPNGPPAQNRQNNGSFNGAKPLNDERQEKQEREREWRGEERMERSDKSRVGVPQPRSPDALP